MAEQRDSTRGLLRGCRCRERGCHTRSDEDSVHETSWGPTVHRETLYLLTEIRLGKTTSNKVAGEGEAARAGLRAGNHVSQSSGEILPASTPSQKQANQGQGGTASQGRPRLSLSPASWHCTSQQRGLEDAGSREGATEHPSTDG